MVNLHSLIHLPLPSQLEIVKSGVLHNELVSIKRVIRLRVNSPINIIVLGVERLLSERYLVRVTEV